VSGTQIVRSKIKGLEFDLRCSQKLVANNPTRRSKNHGSHHVGQDVLDEDRPGSLCLTVGHLFLSSSMISISRCGIVEKRRLAVAQQNRFMVGSKRMNLGSNYNFLTLD